MKRISQPEEAEERKSLMMSPSKPFTVAGSGIPKPTAAVKGTAKISVKKSTAPEAERTPGDGKEVAKCIHPPSEPSALADSDSPSFKKIQGCNGNPPEGDSMAVEAEPGESDEADAIQLDDGRLSNCGQVAKILPMISNSSDVVDDQSNGNSHNWVPTPGRLDPPGIRQESLPSDAAPLLLIRISPPLLLLFDASGAPGRLLADSWQTLGRLLVDLDGMDLF